MSIYLIEGAALTDIADAIRQKRGGSDPLTPGEMPGEILSISSGTATLPEQVTLTASAGAGAAVELSWENPTEAFAGLLIVRKAGSLPTSPTDGDAVYNGSGTAFTDTGVEEGTTYFYRPYPYNSEGGYQTVLTGYAQITPSSNILLSEIPAGVKNILTPEGQWFDKLSGDKTLESTAHPVLFSQYLTTSTISITANGISQIRDQILPKYSDAVRAKMYNGSGMSATQYVSTLNKSQLLSAPFSTSTAADANRLRDTVYTYWCDSYRSAETDDGDTNYYRYTVHNTGVVKEMMNMTPTLTGAAIPFLPDTMVSGTPNASGQYTMIV